MVSFAGDKKTIISRTRRKKKNIPKYLKLILIKVEENRILYHSRHLTPRIESNSLEKEEKKLRNTGKKNAYSTAKIERE